MSKLVKTMVTSIGIVLLGGVIAFIIVFNVTGQSLTSKSEAESIETLVKHSFETPEITTDLQDGSFVRIQFQVLTDSKEAQKEISNREFQLKNILIKELAEMDEEDFKKGLTELESTIQNKLNELMTEGNVIDVYTTNKILQ